MPKHAINLMSVVLHPTAFRFDLFERDATRRRAGDVFIGNSSMESDLTRRYDDRSFMHGDRLAMTRIATSFKSSSSVKAHISLATDFYTRK